MQLLNDPSVKKFYQNEVLDVPISKLDNYEDQGKIKMLFPSSRLMNDTGLDLSRIKNA